MTLLAVLALMIFQAPQLVFESPPQLEAVRVRLESIRAEGFADITDVTGGSGGPPIRVVLSPEGSDLARQVPDWIVGFAVARSELVVIFPARSPAYPHASLEDVLRHEIAHVLIRRASGGGDVPRWFNEGLAMAAERGWRLEDRTRLISLLATGVRTDAAELERLFTGGQSEQSRAYTLSGALARDIRQEFGELAPREILNKMATGLAFDAAFADVTGVTPPEAFTGFWNRRSFWIRWLPIIFAQETLWLAITFLAIIAIRRRRRRNREIEKMWADEDAEDSPDARQ